MFVKDVPNIPGVISYNFSICSSVFEYVQKHIQYILSAFTYKTTLGSRKNKIFFALFFPWISVRWPETLARSTIKINFLAYVILLVQLSSSAL